MIRIRKGKKEGRVSNLRSFTASQYGIRDLRIYGSKVAGIHATRSEIDIHHLLCFLTSIIIPPAWLCIGGTSA